MTRDIDTGPLAENDGASVDTLVREGGDEAPAPAEPSSELNWEDPWDRGEVQREPTTEPETFAATYGTFRGHALTPPGSLEHDSRFSEVEIAAAARDVGIAAAHGGIPADAAQAAFDVVAAGYEPPPPGGFDEDRGLSELNLIAGAERDAIIAKAQKYTESRPALRALLEDETRGMLGNHPRVVLTLAALTDGLGTKQGAERYLRAIRTPGTPENKAYFSENNKLAVFRAQLAYAVTGSR